MNPAQLLSHFDRIGEAPEAVPRLRRFILELAVRGKLVTQDSTETVGDSIPEIRPQFEDCVTPENWRWTEFGEVATISGGFAFKSGDYAPSGVFVLRVTNIEPSGVISKSDAVFLANEKISPEIERFYLNPGDILLVMVGGSLGKIGVVLADVLPALLNQNLWRITPANEEVDRHYLKLLIDFIVSFQRKITHSTHGHLSREDFRKKAIALPPLAEQHRIVAKVDELMALCDRLEATQTERENRRDRLVASSLNGLNNGADADAFREHARFYFNHLPRLTTRPDHIKQLRQIILNLAVRGKLVPQDPTDESASELLKRIEAKKGTLLSKAMIRKTKACRQFDERAIPYLVSNSWEWTMLGTITDIGTGSTPSRAQPSFWNDGTIPWVTSSSTSLEVITTADEFVTKEAVKAHRLRLFQPGTLLVALYGQGKTRGQVAILGIESTINQACAAICPLVGFEKMQAYLRLMLLKFYDEIRMLAAGGAQPNLNVQKIKELLVPIPPLAEQHRIVAKVDELMALCDQLETQLTTTQSESRHLLEAVLHEALAKQTGKD